MSNFSIFSSDCYRYENEILKIEVLGGIKMEGLDRLRATLKIQLAIKDAKSPLEGRKPQARGVLRHSLDLYNDNQVERLTRKVAERLEVGMSVVEGSFEELTEYLEQHRLEERDKLQDQTPQIQPLSHKQRSEAESFLQTANLLQATTELLKNSGIVGEEQNALVLYLAMTSRLTKDPLSVICLAKSGTGKSYLMEKVAECFPAEDLRENTALTENSFYYYGKQEIKGKVFLIEDLDGASDVLYPIRELQSKKRISKTVTMKDRNGKTRSITLIVEGPVSVIGCTTKERIYEDNANRSILIYLDSSKQQDERILDYIKQRKAGNINTHQEEKIQTKLQDVQRTLQPIKVINPYAPLIQLPKEVFKPRRTMSLLLNFIETITFYHQFAREQKVDESTGEMFITTEPEDIEQAFDLLKDVLFRKSDELSGACRSFYEWLKACPALDAGAQGFTASDIRNQKRIHPRTVQRYCKELVDFGFLEITGGKKHTGYEYKLAEKTKKDNLQDSLSKQIKAILKKVYAKSKK